MKYIINGGRPLNGDISLIGAKNAASKAMIASLLTSEESILKNCPQIGEIEIVSDICRIIGSRLQIDGNTITISTPEIKNHSTLSLNRKNRLPILVLGPLLARVGEAEIPFLGGDKIGPRPVNWHLDALKSMGAIISQKTDSYHASAPHGLSGAHINLPFPSVGATENILLAAVIAKGRTVINNAAIEPEVIDLVKMLQQMGAIIGLGANRSIIIDGVKKLKGVTHTIIPDRNEAVSFACLAVATGGKILVKNAIQEHLLTFLNDFRRLGGEWEVKNNGILFFRDRPLVATHIETDTHPGFMTDWQQPFVVLTTQAKGVSVVHETIYEDRFGYTEDLNLMGADIKVEARCLGETPCRFRGRNYFHSAVIQGPTPLKARDLTVRDLRAGIAHIIAALVADGRSVISGIEEIDRGYENIGNRLASLGADIKITP